MLYRLFWEAVFPSIDQFVSLLSRPAKQNKDSNWAISLTNVCRKRLRLLIFTQFVAHSICLMQAKSQKQPVAVVQWMLLNRRQTEAETRFLQPRKRRGTPCCHVVWVPVFCKLCCRWCVWLMLKWVHTTVYNSVILMCIQRTLLFICCTWLLFKFNHSNTHPNLKSTCWRFRGNNHSRLLFCFNFTSFWIFVCVGFFKVV